MYCISQNENEKIVDHFGRAFYEKVLKDVEAYSNKWRLEILQMVDYYSVNCIFLCHSEKFGDAVLKICKPSIEVLTEINTLQEYNGRRFCKVFDSDTENGVILEERILPGIRLRDEKSLEKRLSIFSSLFNGLHIEPAITGKYPTYVGWVSKITNYMSKREDYKALYSYMKKAEDICLFLDALYPKRMLLHGDLHHDNILLSSNGRYKIIDPKGVLADSIFDVSRFILNEFENDISVQLREKIYYIISFFEKSLNIPSSIIKQCVFVEVAMANCWNVESGTVPNMDEVIFAQNIMNS